MKISTSLQLLTCLMVYAPCAHSIMVKFGTKGGPIDPPTPEPTQPPPRQPYQAPAPVWEERANDAPDPNANWRPQLFVPQPRYTQVIFSAPPTTQQPLNNAQRFVNAYIPKSNQQVQPIQAPAVQNYLTPSQILSSQSLPGIGIRYFVPTYVELRREQEDVNNNRVETYNVEGQSRESVSDAQWKYEKDASRRASRNTYEGSANHPYQWPAFVFPRHHQ